jgi:1-aminocyclopropane-1-carboxylate deaminase/D-cysteine desulfhydrase-like pyridoxal-dependent ACC family enzyme
MQATAMGEQLRIEFSFDSLVIASDSGGRSAGLVLQ